MNNICKITRTTILLADDDALLREVTAEILTLSGYQVLISADGLEAKKIFAEHQDRITLALLDIVMPGCCGKELAEHIRLFNPDLPIFFMTGYDKLHMLDGIQHMENTEVFYKPVQFGLLLQSIEQSIKG